MLFPYEVFAVPTELATGAALETGIADVNPELTFFLDLLPWFEQGHYPLGLREEKLIVW